MEIIIHLEIDGQKGDEGALRESVYAYLYELIRDDSLDYEIREAKT